MEQLYALSETKFTPGARPNLRPKRAKIYALSEPPPVSKPVDPETSGPNQWIDNQWIGLLGQELC